MTQPLSARQALDVVDAWSSRTRVVPVEHGAEPCSRDADFSRFPGVRWVDSLR